MSWWAFHSFLQGGFYFCTRWFDFRCRFSTKCARAFASALLFRVSSAFQSRWIHCSSHVQSYHYSTLQIKWKKEKSGIFRCWVITAHWYCCRLHFTGIIINTVSLLLLFFSSFSRFLWPRFFALNFSTDSSFSSSSIFFFIRPSHRIVGLSNSGCAAAQLWTNLKFCLNASAKCESENAIERKVWVVKQTFCLFWLFFFASFGFFPVAINAFVTTSRALFLTVIHWAKAAFVVDYVGFLLPGFIYLSIYLCATVLCLHCRVFVSVSVAYSLLSVQQPKRPNHLWKG